MLGILSSVASKELEDTRAAFKATLSLVPISYGINMGPVAGAMYAELLNIYGESLRHTLIELLLENYKHDGGDLQRWIDSNDIDNKVAGNLHEFYSIALSHWASTIGPQNLTDHNKAAMRGFLLMLAGLKGKN